MANRTNTKLNKRKEATFLLTDVAIPKMNVTQKESEKKVNTGVNV